MRNDMEYVACPSCGNTVPKSRFCVECGAPLSDSKPAPVSEQEAFNTAKNPDRSVKPSVPLFFRASKTEKSPAQEREALSDKGLTLLVNTCRKTVATVGGDGYSEIVLYLDEATGKYWLHTYSKYVYMEKEAHASYTAPPELAEKVFAYIEEHNLASWKDNRGPSLCGGDYIVRFRHGDGAIRLNSGNMPDGQHAYSEINGMLYAYATEENRRYRDE